MPAVNWVAVVAAVVAALVIGSIYYSPMVFGKRLDTLNNTPLAPRTPQQAVGIQVVFSLIAMLVLAVLISMSGQKGLAGGATVGFWAWLLVVMADAGQTNFTGRPWALWILDSGNWLITFLVAGAVIGALS